MARGRGTLIAGRLGVIAWVAVSASTASADDSLQAETRDPRAYGYRVGDIAHREITVRAPAGLQLDPDSLPRAGVPGQAIELRTLTWRRDAGSPGSRYELSLDYQVFVSPPEVKTLEMPPLRLRFTGGGKAPQDLRIEAWPITVSPLMPVEASARQGLGEMQPDVPPPQVDTMAATRRLLACVVLAAVLALYLASVYIGLPWWSRRHRPFDQAWQQVKALPDATDGGSADAARYRDACRAVHTALNRVAGEVLFAGGIEGFVSRHPAFGAVRDDLVDFFDRSRRAFFADDVGTAADRNAVRALCRRCRDIGRGAA